MAKNIIRLNESDIQELVRRSVQKIIKESKWAHNQDGLDWKTPTFDDDDKLDTDYEDFLARQEKPLTDDDIDGMYGEHLNKIAEDPSIDADAVMDEDEYQSGKLYGENLLAKGKDVSGIVDELIKKEKENDLTIYETGILDALVDPNDIDL